jgi:Trk K+ transport system NAD-binding subunit
MAMALTKPAVGDFLDSVTANHLELGFEQLEVDSVSTLVNRKLSETVIRSELNIVIVSIRRNNGEIIFNPGAENPNLAKAASAAGIEVVEDCTLVMLQSGTF